MSFLVEYHGFVIRLAPRSIPAMAVLGSLLLLALASSSLAQVNGVPPSVTSPGFGGRAINGTPPSVTSLGRNGFSQPNSGVTFSTGPFRDVHGEHHRHRSTYRPYYYPYVYAVPVPYAVDGNYPDDPDDDADYQGGPTIFDRRGAGAESYVPPFYPGPAHARSPQKEDTPAGAASSPEQPQLFTTLVFKDGHQAEVGNYAIVSQTLYDLTAGHPRKIALSDLDISATQRQNEERGVVFQLPPPVQAN